jgi:archaellum component FlaF (FlaF/FlaG flagellin family)
VTRSLFRNKRGVSEIVASLIILLIVTVAGAGLYAYSLNAFSSSGSSFLLQTSGKEERAQEQLLITTVWWNVSNDYLNITVLNYGKIELVIDAVYIDGTQVLASAYTDGKGETVATKSLVSVKFTSPVLIADGETYEIIVVSERGSNDVVYWEA